MNDILFFFVNQFSTVYNIFYVKIIILIILLLWAIKNIFYIRFNKMNADIKLISQVNIDNNKIIIVVVDNMKFILGITTNNITVLHTTPYKNNTKNYIYSNKKHIFHFKFNKLINIACKVCLFFIFMLYPHSAHALGLSEVTQNLLLNNIQHWSLPIQILVFMTCLTFSSLLFLMTTSFTRILIVLSLLRNALGTPSLPPNQVLIIISLFLTFFIMSPTVNRIYEEAYIPLCENKIQLNEAIVKGYNPIKNFMMHQARKSDLIAFSKISHTNISISKNDVPIQILFPAFITSELKTAFQIGFTIFIPFLIIDLIVASILMSLGMIMITPSSISLPIKLILFVLVDGWQLLCSSLVRSFY